MCSINTSWQWPQEENAVTKYITLFQELAGLLLVMVHGCESKLNADLFLYFILMLCVFVPKWWLNLIYIMWFIYIHVTNLNNKSGENWEETAFKIKCCRNEPQTLPQNTLLDPSLQSQWGFWLIIEHKRKRFKIFVQDIQCVSKDSTCEI